MKLVFDAEPLLAYLLAEAPAPRVEGLLEGVAAGRHEGLVSRVTWTEVSYLLRRERPRSAGLFLESLERNGLQVAECGGAWQQAARLKARHPRISLADAYAAGTAQATQGTLVLLGDKPLAEACRVEGIAIRRP